VTSAASGMRAAALISNDLTNETPPRAVAVSCADVPNPALEPTPRSGRIERGAAGSPGKFPSAGPSPRYNTVRARTETAFVVDERHRDAYN
jgi:hypothetical protein